MDYNNIKWLIDKYWDGNTRIEEDQTIKIFFSEHFDLPEDLEKWRSWFTDLSNISNIELDNNFDTKILKHIEQQELIKVKKTFFLRFRNIAAACIVLSVISFSAWKITSYQTEKQEKLAMLQAKEEYEQIKNMLYFTSSKINETEKAVQKNFSKINVMNEIINIK